MLVHSPCQLNHGSSHPLIIRAGCPHAQSEVSHRCLKMTWCSKVAKDAWKSAQSGPAIPSDPPKNGQVMVFSRFFNEHLTGVVSLGPTGENKTGMRSSRMKSRKEEHKYWLGRTNLESAAWWNINGHRLKSHQLVAGVHNKSLRWWCSLYNTVTTFKYVEGGPDREAPE